MKINPKYTRVMTLLIVSFFLLLESVWVIYLYQIEKAEFITTVNKTIGEATNQITARTYGIEQPHYSTIVSPTGYIQALKYVKDSVPVLIEGSHIPKYGLSLREYDLRSKYWTLDSVYQQFKRLSQYPNLPITLIRRDHKGQLIDYFPSTVAIPQEATYPSSLLGCIDDHRLAAHYTFPLSYFWAHQQYGLLLSLLPMFLLLFYNLLFIKRQSAQHKAIEFLEQQAIFIHDLKTPLCTNLDIEKRIMDHLNSWSKEKICEKLKISHLQFCHVQAEIRQIIHRSVTQWGGNIESAPFDLHKALETLITDQKADHENVHIQLDFQLENPIIVADSFHIIHMVTNLIANAIKHADKNVNINIICRYESKYLVISVKDNGPGISPHERKYIFKEGYRGKRKSDKGHGFGLAYVRRIVRQYHGKIQVKSREKEGTEFLLKLNLHKAKQSIRTKFTKNIYKPLYYCLLITEIIWLYNLYASERKIYQNRNAELLYRSTYNVSKQLIHFCDTIKYQIDNNTHTITATRGKQKAIIPLEHNISDRKIFRHLSYDLRGTKWGLDTIYRYYRALCKNDLPIVFTRTDSTGNTIDSYPAGDIQIFSPLTFTLPLGYVEKHQLKAQYAFPWLQPLITHRTWLLLTLASLLLLAHFTRKLSTLTQQQKTIIRFQQEEVQQGIRKLDEPINHLLNNEEYIIRQFEHLEQEDIHHRLSNNTKAFNPILESINYLLDRLVILKQTNFNVNHEQQTKNPLR